LSRLSPASEIASANAIQPNDFLVAPNRGFILRNSSSWPAIPVFPNRRSPFAVKPAECLSNAAYPREDPSHPSSHAQDSAGKFIIWLPALDLL
jgi:hypothetical protein